MSRLDKLKISGVRSFEAGDRAEIIEFLSPVTLIVGSNGTGKTTIIECLKYAATGILPANSKTGGAFIHDPKLCGERTVLAQVVLQYISITGAITRVQRSLQLTVKNKIRSQKTCESLLFEKRHAEVHAIQKKNIEIDQFVPDSFGVSTAVLDNVIFCHQDDSLWPLSEPANLKKRFDEIFEAQKYIKAVENLKQLRKKQNEELGKYKLSEQHARSDKDRAVKMERKIDGLRAEVEILRPRVRDLEARIKQAAKDAHDAWKHSESYSEILGTLQGKRIEAQSKESNIQGLQAHLKEVPESDEWLQSSLDEFETRLEQHQVNRQQKQEEYLEKKDVIENCRSSLIKKHNEHGEHEHAKAENNRQVSRRQDMIRSVASKHGLRGFDDPSDDTIVSDFMFKVRKLAKDQQAALDRIRTEANIQKKDAQIVVNRLIERKSTLQDSKITARNQIAQYDKSATQYQSQVDRISIDEGTKANLESKIENLNERLKGLHNTASNNKWDQLLRDADAERGVYDAEGTRLRTELIQGSKKAEETARLSHLKQELKDRTRSLTTLMDTHSKRITKLIGSGWTTHSCEEVHQQAHSSAMEELNSAERQRDATARELEQVLFKVKTTKETLKQRKQEMKTCESQVRKALDGADPSEYHNTVDGMRQNLDIMKTNANNAGGLVPYFQSILQTAQMEKPTCRVCERPFIAGNDPALTKMKNKLAGLIQKAAAKLDEDEIKAAEDDLKEVLDAAGPLEVYNRLHEKEIPLLEREQSSLSQQREKVTAKVEEHDKVVETRQSARNELDQISRPIGSISRSQGEIDNLQSQLKDLAAKQANSGSARTLEDIQQDISSCAEKVRVSQQKISQLNADKEQSQTAISTLDLELGDLKLQLSSTASTLEKKVGLVVRVDEFRALGQKQREAINGADEDLDKIEPEIATAQAKYDDVAQRTEAQEKAMSHKCSELLESVNQLNLANDQIQSYFDRDVPGKIKTTTKEIARIEQEIKSLESEQNDVSRDTNKITEQLRDSENIRRQYHDNLRYRQESRALEKLSDEIAHLEGQNAAADRDNFKEASDKHRRDHDRLSAQKATLFGEMVAKDEQLKEAAKEYETDLKDAKPRYREAHIRVETTKAAVEDLARYAAALDNAITHFHTMKMAAVNDIIEEMWRKTYQGTDVDTIMIKTENEKATAVKSHSYRVVMRKQDAEMDMRGRCSAGQKVLASIIIRLALAECFASNCGLIALDEPTTNLDQDNIAALASALHEVIEFRQQQSNFQLIIITHDEEFLKLMRPGDFVGHFWRLDRNERCNSTIEKQSIAHLV